MVQIEEDGSELRLDLNIIIDRIAREGNDIKLQGYRDHEKLMLGHDIYCLAKKHGLLDDFESHATELGNGNPPDKFLVTWIDAFLMFYLSQTKSFLDQVEKGASGTGVLMSNLSEDFREMFFQVTAKKLGF